MCCASYGLPLVRTEQSVKLRIGVKKFTKIKISGRTHRKKGSNLMIYHHGLFSFVPEAGIINYYHMDSTLSGHTDHSELDLTAPLFSIR